LKHAAGSQPTAESLALAVELRSRLVVGERHEPCPEGAWRDRIICGDARDMRIVPDAAISLVVTSPPY
jgi:hypothetical protein